MVAGAPVPALRDAGRAQLYKAEWHIGPDKHMAVATAADSHVYIVTIVFLLLVAGRQAAQKG